MLGLHILVLFGREADEGEVRSIGIGVVVVVVVGVVVVVVVVGYSKEVSRHQLLRIGELLVLLI